jgi:putative flippase GtrA
MDDYENLLLRFHLRFFAWSITVTAALLVAIGFTLLPHIGSLTAQLLGVGSAFVGLGTGFAAALWHLNRDTRSKENP